ncbi:aminotransferase [Streptomyces abyssalis]|uniref:Histidinol-phosphate aminotransferase n=1 Tax=Streptomyces abyssalis TaxID=933944 RepID=A0A1E7JKM8_9ACTN|nr:histidinol-phosphate transaminase [Streptomyces abyssalis]OEU88198.1 aminotransferase [Streptomyces abyssalis]OEU91069.1 aminotransferase [Streptomyces abyssalis]OEV09412.1 aminotransferase [Streptomyces nanshensis]
MTTQERLPRFRAAVRELVSYRPEKPALSPEGRSYALAANETPFGPLPEVARAIQEQTEGINRYPDNTGQALTAEIAERFGVDPDGIALGCGSVGVAQQLITAVAEPGDEVLYAWPSFEAYPLLTRLAGAVPVAVPLRDNAHDLATMAEHFTDRTRLVFVCNPNNPTGTVVGRAELEEFLGRVPPGCLVVLDEAYHEYVRDKAVPDGLSLVPGRPHLVVLRTFSKAYGLAGLRIGYAAGHPEVIGTLRKAYLPYSAGSLAQAAAIAALRSGDEVARRTGVVTAERTRLAAALDAHGWRPAASEANFLWLPLGERATVFGAHCATAGVSVRAVAGAGVRVTVGLPSDNDAFLAAAASFPSA